VNEVLILDVGHGNSAIVRHDDEAVVIDSPLKDHLVDALRLEGIDRVRLAIASHSDSDHCGGFIGLLLAPDIVVDELRINPDATRHTRKVSREFWGDLKVAWRAARDMHGTRIRTELTDQLDGDLSAGSLRLEVVYPSGDLALDGVGSAPDGGPVVTPNAMSAVVRVVLDGVPLALLPGDMDAAGLDHLVSSGVDISALVLVFPHHGGRPEGASSEAAAVEYTKKLMEACGPSTVLFSIGRGVHGTPRPEIVRAVRESGAHVHIACTQLSQRCSDELLGDLSHLSARYASGRATGRSCLGTAVLLPASGLTSPQRGLHEAAVSLLPNRLCQ
jgi:beta-lactamase superfamily II metal-dependent hydrolase